MPKSKNKQKSEKYFPEPSPDIINKRISTFYHLPRVRGTLDWNLVGEKAKNTYGHIFIGRNELDSNEYDLWHAERDTLVKMTRWAELKFKNIWNTTALTDQIHLKIATTMLTNSTIPESLRLDIFNHMRECIVVRKNAYIEYILYDIEGVPF